MNESCMNWSTYRFEIPNRIVFSPTRFNTSKSLFISVRLTSVIRIHISISHDFFSPCSRAAHVSQPYSKYTFDIYTLGFCAGRTCIFFFYCRFNGALVKSGAKAADDLGSRRDIFPATRSNPTSPFLIVRHIPVPVHGD